MYLRLDGQDIPVVSASIKWTQNAAAEIDVTVAAALIDWENCRFKDIEIWKDGILYASGFVFDSPALSFDNDKNVMCSLGCVDTVGQLTRERAKSDAHYQNSLVTSIVQDLLNATSDWLIGSTSTMVDLTAKTTVDLRSKESLWAQLVGLAEAVPQIFFRYGGYNDVLSKHLLDVGNFNKETVSFIQGHNVGSIQLQKSSGIPYTVVEAYGGKLLNRKVNLHDALLYTPSVTLHPDYATYPIQLDPVRGTYIVRDLSPGKVGNQVTKTLNTNKTKNDVLPSVAQISEAGFGLWRNVVRFLKANTEYRTFTVSGKLPSVPQISDRAWLQGTVTEPIYDPVSNSFSWHETFSVANSFRITRVELNFENSSTIADPVSDLSSPAETYTVEISDNDYVEPQDDSLEVYSRLEPTDGGDDLPAMLGILNQQNVSVTFPTSAPADPTCSGGAWKEFVFNFTVPDGAVSVFYNILPVQALGVTFKITQLPTISGLPLKICVQQAGGWPGTTAVTVVAQFTFN